MPVQSALDVNLLDRYDTFLFDGDGTLWHFDDIIDGANEVRFCLVWFAWCLDGRQIGVCILWLSFQLHDRANAGPVMNLVSSP